MGYPGAGNGQGLLPYLISVELLEHSPPIVRRDCW